LSEELLHNDEIDKYLMGEMGVFEQGLFEHKLSQDEELAAEVEMRKMAKAIIEEHRHKELKEYIRKNAPRQVRLGFWQTVAAYSSAAVVLFFAISWVVLEFYIPQSGKLAYEESQKSKNKSEEEYKQDKGNVKMHESEENPSFPIFSDKKAAPPTDSQTQSPDVLAYARAPQSGDATAPMAESASETNGGSMIEDEYKVKADELVLDTNYIAVLLDPNHTNASEKKKAAFKNEADSKLRKDKSALPVRSLQVEFWKSPINYRGYRYNGKKLQLFGVQNPSQIQFKLIAAELYLLMNGQVYQMMKEDRYNSYWPETDKNLLLLLKEE
jgi:hypothetical protein